MNQLEKIGIDKLNGHLWDIHKRVTESTPENFEHRKIFILRGVKDAISTLDAIKEANPQLYPK